MLVEYQCRKCISFVGFLFFFNLRPDAITDQYLEVENIVNRLGRSATRKRWLGINHFISDDPKWPPVALDPIRAVRTPIYSGQDLRREKVLGPDRYCGNSHLEKQKIKRHFNLNTVKATEVNKGPNSVFHSLFCLQSVLQLIQNQLA